MMFDLNIDISPAHSEPKTASEEASGDRDSDNAISALNFDIFSKLRTTPAPADVVPDNDDDDEVDGGADRPGFVTWQLFPATGAGSSSDTQWLNLSVSGSGSGSHSQSEVRIPPPQQPQPQPQPQQRRSRRGPRSRSSQYRGVTFYRRTGRWESHIWDCGKQVYLGGFDTAFAAARAYDRAAIKFRGVDADINFTVSDYDEDLKQMKNLNKEEFVHALRRQSTGCSRGSSRYRGVILQKAGRLEAPMGQYLGKKAYDKAAVQFSGREVVSSFVPSNYEMKMPVEVNGELGHNLDLNLGMSVSSERPQGVRNVQVYPRPTLYHPTDDKTMMPGSSNGPPNGQILSGQLYSSNHSAIWHGAPVVSTIHAERAVQENQVDTVPSSTFSNWARNMQAGRHGGANQVVPHFRSAASSGFSF